MDKTEHVITLGTLKTYTDRLKQYISDATVQADWEETDTSKDSFIQNKPDFNGLADTVGEHTSSIAEIETELPEFAKLNGGNIFTGEQQFENIKVHNIAQDGENYETHAEQIYTKNDYIILRDNAVSGLANGTYAGFQATKYDGENDGRLVFDSTGTARVGDVDDEQPLATRAEAATLEDRSVMVWDANTYKLVGGGFLSDYQKVSDNTLATTNKTIPGAINELKSELSSGTPAATPNTLVKRDVNGKAFFDPMPLTYVPDSNDSENPSYIYRNIAATMGDIKDLDTSLKQLQNSIDASLWNQGTTYVARVYLCDGENANISDLSATYISYLDAIIAMATNDISLAQSNGADNIHCRIILPYNIGQANSGELRDGPIVACIDGTRELIYAEVNSGKLTSDSIEYLTKYIDGDTSKVRVETTSKVLNFINYSDKQTWQKCVSQFSKLKKAFMRVTPHILTCAQANIRWTDGSYNSEGIYNHAPNFWANLMLTRLTPNSGLLSIQGAYHDIDGTTDAFNNGYNFSLRTVGNALGIRIITHSNTQEITGTYTITPPPVRFPVTITPETESDAESTISFNTTLNNYSVGGMIKNGAALNLGFKPYGEVDSNIPGYLWQGLGPASVGKNHMVAIHNVYIEWE